MLQPIGTYKRIWLLLRNYKGPTHKYLTYDTKLRLTGKSCKKEDKYIKQRMINAMSEMQKFGSLRLHRLPKNATNCCFTWQ